jgi:DNA-binding transcriptional regulator GbsR (MarR family)
MENRDVARLLGALSMETRLGIIGSLIDAGDAGLTQVEISEVTGLSAASLWQHLDYMTTVDLVTTKLDGYNKSFMINANLLQSLISIFSDRYLPGYFQGMATDKLSMAMA